MVAREVTDTDGRPLYQSLIEKLIAVGPLHVGGVKLKEYRYHLPTSQRVARDQGWPVVFLLADALRRFDDVGGYFGDEDHGFKRLRAVWTYSNYFPSSAPLPMSRGHRWPALPQSPWMQN